jgi:FtsZ-interacting cell division protein ZipA
MSTTLAIIIAVIVVVAIAVAAFFYWRNRQSKHLQSRFGPEYQRALEETGNRREAEAALHKRETRVEKFDIRALPPEERARYQTSWRRTQADFVDNPRESVSRADELLGAVMSARGYPVSDFEQRSADLSVDYPMVVQNYRAGHDIALRHRRGEANTEDLRQAMIHYRALFDELTAEPARAKAS